jgi:hypothetical protein
MTDPTLTKLRLTYERLQRDLDERQEVLNEFKKQVSAAKAAYSTRARELGICPGCMKAQSDCACVLLTYEFSPVTYDEFNGKLTGGWAESK